MAKVITVDFETRSEVDLKIYGRYNYINHPSFKVIIMAVKHDNNETQVLSMPSKEVIQAVLTEAKKNNAKLVAHNAKFEIAVMQRYNLDTLINIKPQCWRDTMTIAQYYGLPPSLEDAGEYLSIKMRKLATGKDLITFWTKPIPEKTKQRLGLPVDKIFWEPEDWPEKWAMFCEYSKYDVEASYEIFNTLPDVPEHIWEEWTIDLNINQRGILVDADFCKIATDDLAEEEEEAMEELKQLTGLENPKSKLQLKVWLKDFHNLDIPSLNNEAMQELINNPNLDSTIKHILFLHANVSKTSTAKYKRILELMSNENKIYDILNFYGARTGRWSSWGVQLHNMKRIEMEGYKEIRQEAKDKVLPLFHEGLADLYSKIIRTVIIAPTNKKLVIADFAQIEARVLQWLANDQKTLDIFRSGKDYYTYTAAQMFNKHYEDIPKDSVERRKGKVAALALGYGGALGALDRSPASKELTTTEKLSLIKLWRKANSKVVKLWEVLNAAFIKCFTSKSKVIIPVGLDQTLIFDYQFLKDKHAVTVTLPSGRTIWYNDVKAYGRDYVFYGKASDDQFTSTYVKVYGGFLAENITQAIARDCLQIFINRLTTKGIPVVFHVHDEVICEVDTKSLKDNIVSTIGKLSQEEIYKGLPVSAEPKASEYYDK